MRRALRLALLLVPSAALQGCLTAGLFDWAEDRGPVVDGRAEEVMGSRFREADGGFDLDVRWSDGHNTLERWRHDDPDAPAAALEEARLDARCGSVEDALTAVERAVRRGWPRRDFAADPDLAGLADRPGFAAACVAPVTSPAWVVAPAGGPPEAVPDQRWVEVRLRSGGEEVVALRLAPRVHDESRGGPLGLALAIVGWPVTIALDVVTFPAQVVLLLVVLDAIIP